MGAKPSAFRKMLASDNVNVFLNLEEFGEYHKVDGKTVRCVVDDDIYGKASGGHEYGVTDATFTLFMLDWELERRYSGDQLEYDGRIYTVVDFRIDEGMARVTLREPTAY